MRKLKILFFTALFACASLFAQKAEIQQAVERYKNMNTLTAAVTWTRHNAAVTQDVVTQGHFYFKKPGRMCMTFNDGKDMLLMDGNTFAMVTDGKKSVAKGEGSNQFELNPGVSAMSFFTPAKVSLTLCPCSISSLC